MYFPYLRGKQFELIALRELCNSLHNFSEKISPVVEPVKNSSTFKTTLSELANRNVNFNIIINPNVGGLVGEGDKIIETLNSTLAQYVNYQIAIIIDSKIEEQIPALIHRVSELEITYGGITLIHYSEIAEDSLELLQDNLDITYNLIYFSKTSRRYYRSFPEATRVSLDDYFRELPRNADYLNIDQSPFSDEYRYYTLEGFAAFSDFLTVGSSYSDSGFLPRAVAIHLSYIDAVDRVMVKHFVSDSNGDVSDIGGKFAEAIQKLVDWCDENNIQTNAVNIFRELHQRGHFPGLGTLKKLSIMNHIELILGRI